MDTADTGAISDTDLERVDGAVRLTFGARDGRPVLEDLYQRTPCRVMFPRVEGRLYDEIVLINTAGGLTGGDRLSCELTIGGPVRVTATGQAAEKIYRAIDSNAAIATRIEAAAGAAMEWLPQETILFEGSRLVRDTEIRIADGASVLALEWTILGREAHGEHYTVGELVDRWRVLRDDALIWADIFRLNAETMTFADRPALLAGCRAFATIVVAGGDVEPSLETVRARLDGLGAAGGATIVAGILISRLAAETASALRSAVVNVLLALRQARGGMPDKPPAVWGC